MPPLPPDAIVRVVTAFAKALDHEDFIGAARWLASDATYEIGGRTLVGSVAILASYADASTWAARVFDEVRYESEIGEAEVDRVAVTYTDHLAKGERRHTHRCRQHLTVNDEGRVSRIVHEEIAGEREKLDAFFAACGVERGRRGGA
jgi:hypothetical protein